MTLAGITWDHARGYDPLIACSALYEKLFGIKVNWEKRSLANFGDQSLAALAERFDLLIMDHPHAGVAVKTNCLLPLNRLLPVEKLSKLREQTAGPCFASYNYKGQQWALPIDAAMQCCAYRQDLYEEVAIPKTWEEVFQLTHLLKKKNMQVGMALCPTDSLCTFLSVTAQMGSPVCEGNEILVNHNVGLKVLQLMRRMRDHFHEDSLHWNPIQLYDNMAAYDDVAYAPLAFCYTNYSRSNFRKNILKYGNAPEIKHALLGGAGIAVSSKSKYAREAVHYAAWICSEEIQSSVYVTEQGQPANIVAWKSGFANELTNHFFSGTFETLENAFMRPRYNGWPAFQKHLGEVVHAFLKDDTDPVKVLNSLQEVYRESYKV